MNQDKLVELLETVGKRKRKIKDSGARRSLEDNGDKNYCFHDDEEEFIAWKSDKCPKHNKITVCIVLCWRYLTTLCYGFTLLVTSEHQYLTC
jgi:hypothetical protein